VAEIVERVLAAERSAAIQSTDTMSADDGSDVEVRNTEAYLADDAYFEVWPGYSDHARAKKLAQEGREQEALDLLAQVYQTAQRVKGVGLMIEARSAQALIYQSQGKLECALEALEDALCLSEPESYVRSYADLGAPMAQLLHQAAARGIKPSYTTKLLAAFGTQAPRGALAPRSKAPRLGLSPPAQPLVEPLSPRELEVLELIAQGLSNREICERLFLALSTVKGHNRNLYGKLQVQSRTQAVARARELGLL
jgi:LuxR family maltose regulon positive regulatory protein